MKALKLFTFALTFLAFFSQGMVAGMQCEMMADKNITSTQSDIPHMGHNMAAEMHSSMDHSGHDMPEMANMDMQKHDMQSQDMQSQDMSDCCDQNCTCNMAGCSSIVIASNVFLPSPITRATDKLSLNLSNASKPFPISLYRPPINS